MESNRKATPQEERLLEILIKKASFKVSQRWKDDLLVCPMDDGNMGSLYLFLIGQPIEDRKMGGRISELQFTDIDGVEVIASLNIDTNGNLFELDIWKTNFEKLLKFPDL